MKRTYCACFSRKYASSGTRGFTLIELIITLVLVAFVGVMMVTFMRSQVVSSVDPVLLVQEDYRVIDGMENITTQYRSQLENKTLQLSNFTDSSILRAYANSTSLKCAGVYISIDSSGAESVSSVPTHFVKVTVNYAHLYLISIFSD